MLKLTRGQKIVRKRKLGKSIQEISKEYHIRNKLLTQIVDEANIGLIMKNISI